jgi:hypothetical protein
MRGVIPETDAVVRHGLDYRGVEDLWRQDKNTEVIAYRVRDRGRVRWTAELRSAGGIARIRAANTTRTRYWLSLTRMVHDLDALMPGLKRLSVDLSFREITDA